MSECCVVGQKRKVSLLLEHYDIVCKRGGSESERDAAYANVGVVIQEYGELEAEDTERY